jgi:hypothetical protein
MLFHVIPAKAGIQCFQGGKNALDPGFHRGDEYSMIFSQLPFSKGETGILNKKAMGIAHGLSSVQFC